MRYDTDRRNATKYELVFERVFEEVSDDSLLDLLQMFDSDIDPRLVVLGMNAALLNEKKLRNAGS